MSGTRQPRNSTGRVYCGYSSSPELWDSSTVDSLVVSADQDEVRKRAQFNGHRLLEQTALWAEQDDAGIGAAHRSDGRENRARFHDHSGPTTVRRVVDRAVPIRGEVPDVDQIQLQQAGLAGPLEHALVERPDKHPGEEGQDVDTHSVKLVLGQPEVVTHLVHDGLAHLADDLRPRPASGQDRAPKED